MPETPRVKDVLISGTLIPYESLIKRIAKKEGRKTSYYATRDEFLEITGLPDLPILVQEGEMYHTIYPNKDKKTGMHVRTHIPPEHEVSRSVRHLSGKPIPVIIDPEHHGIPCRLNSRLAGGHDYDIIGLDQIQNEG